VNTILRMKKMEMNKMSKELVKDVILDGNNQLKPDWSRWYELFKYLSDEKLFEMTMDEAQDWLENR